MTDYTALRDSLKKQFENQGDLGFYTDQNSRGVLQLNFGYGLDFTADGELAINILSAVQLSVRLCSPL